MEKNANWKMGVFMTLEEKALERLYELDPSSPEFNYTLNNIGLMLQIAEQVKYDDHLWAEVDTPTVKPDPVIVTTENEDDGAETAAEEPEPAPAEEPEPAPVPKPDELALTALTFEEVKHLLVTYARAGADVGEALQAVGATCLSDVPPERYAKLLQIAKAAVE